MGRTPAKTPDARYPLDRLAARLRIDLGETGGDMPGQPLRGVAAFTAAVGLTDRRYVCRLRASGVSHRQADRLAVAAGWHPGLVWPWWVNDVVSEEGEEGYYSDDPPMDAIPDPDNGGT